MMALQLGELPIAIDKLVHILYEGKGAHAIPDAISEETRLEILGELAALPYTESEKEYGKAKQELWFHTLTNQDHWQEQCPVVNEFKQAYDEFYRIIGEHAGFTGTPNEVRSNRYEPGPIGITPHKDELRYKYLIGILVVEGEAEFGICTKRNGDDSTPLIAHPRTLLLLGAPRNKGESKQRPLHYVKDITSRRYSLGIRYQEVKP